MVVFVDLDHDVFRHPGSALPLEKPFPSKLRVAPLETNEVIEPPLLQSAGESAKSKEVRNTNFITEDTPAPKIPNYNAFSAALSCYPYVDLPPSKSSPRRVSPHLYDTRTNLTARDVSDYIESLRKLLAPLT